MIFYSPLPDRAVLAVSGEDALEFLQGLITRDMRKVKPGKAAFAALLSPQGRFLFDFFITENDGRFLLETDKARLPDLIKRLTMYRLRSKVAFEELPLSVTAVWQDSHRPEQSEGPRAAMEVLRFAQDDGYDDPRLPGLGYRILFDPSSRRWPGSQDVDSLPEVPANAWTTGDYALHRFLLSVPEGAKDLIIDRSILLEYGYDELGAVDFDKGCYIGQEVTARSKHRATLRKFIHGVRADAPLPPKGTPVLMQEREVGTMCSSGGALGLAHLRVEEARRAARENLPLSAGGVALASALPSWCKTSFQDGPA